MQPIMGSYEWCITDPTLISEIKTAKNLESFTSPTFLMHGFKWYFYY